VAEDPRAEETKPGDAWRIFLPADTTAAPMAVLLRTAGSAAPLIPSIRKAAQEEAPGTAIRVQTLAEIKDAQRRELVPATGGLLAAGLMALLLSAIGLYAVVAFSVSQRTAEIAVRIAVGAHPRQVGGRFIGAGLRLSAIGLALGLPVSLVGLRAIMSADQAFAGVPMTVVTAVAALGVVLVATAATWIPARRAASVDPAVVLRGQ
jgi:putative ABC transport system permease protein